MKSVYVFWVISAFVLILAAVLCGRATINNSIRNKSLAILIDDRGRYSLSHLQIVLWTILVLSLFMGIFLARLFNGVENSINILIPDELLILMGISLGSTTIAGAIKAGKDNRDVRILGINAPRFAQFYLVEEGPALGQGAGAGVQSPGASEIDTIDIGKFQNLWITLIVIVAYISNAWAYIASRSTIAELDSLPGISGTMVTLIGISHAGYIGTKMPDKA